MSALAALLDGAREPGVYRWRSPYDATDLAALVAPRRPGTWRVVHLDGAEVLSRREAQSALADRLGLSAGPDATGVNLDALWDALRDLDGPTVVLWTHWRGLAEADPVGLSALLRVLGLRAAEHRDLAVLLVGDGPEMGAGPDVGSPAPELS